MEITTEQIIKFVAKDGEVFDSEEPCLKYEKRLTNLYEETIRVLGTKINEVLYVNFGDDYTTINDFLEKAKDIWYDAGYGTEKIYGDIYIVGENWWFERAEYDGSEWWKYKEFPTKNKNQREITKGDII